MLLPAFLKEPVDQDAHLLARIEAGPAQEVVYPLLGAFVKDDLARGNEMRLLVLQDSALLLVGICGMKK